MSAPKFQVGDWVRWVGLQNQEEELKLKEDAHIAKVIKVSPGRGAASEHKYWYELFFININGGAVIDYSEESLVPFIADSPDWEV